MKKQAALGNEEARKRQSWRDDAAISRVRQIEKEIELETALGLLLAPHWPVTEEGRREITVNGREIIEQFMSDGSSRVYMGGMRTDWDYARCIRWAGGIK